MNDESKISQHEGLLKSSDWVSIIPAVSIILWYFAIREFHFNFLDNTTILYSSPIPIAALSAFGANVFLPTAKNLRRAINLALPSLICYLFVFIILPIILTYPIGSPGLFLEYSGFSIIWFFSIIPIAGICFLCVTLFGWFGYLVNIRLGISRTNDNPPNKKIE